MQPDVDLIIVGGGLAGVTLAWTAVRRGLNFLIVNAADGPSASAAAAGLVTPVTGPKWVPAWNWNAAFPSADALYGFAEQRLGQSVWHRPSTIRRVQKDQELPRLQGAAPPNTQRETTPELLAQLDAWLAPGLADVALSPAARLDVRAYLAHSRAHFLQQGAWCDHHIAGCDEFRPAANPPFAWTNHELGISGRFVVWCCGAAEAVAERFPGLRFQLCQGESLIIEPVVPDAESSTFSVVAHAGGNWLFRNEEGGYEFGATSRWTDLNGQPSKQGRDELLARLASVSSRQVKIVGMRAGVRPATFDQRPFAGSVPASPPGMAVLNGLGTKGVLYAPSLAEQLLAHLLEGQELDPAVAAARGRTPARKGPA